MIRRPIHEAAGAVAVVTLGVLLVLAHLSDASAADEDSLAALFVSTCVQHLGDATQLAAEAANRGGRRVPDPGEAVDGQTWAVSAGGVPVALHFKQGRRDGRPFVLCLVRQEGDAFDATLEAIKHSLQLRPIRAREEAFTKRASFLLPRDQTLIDLSAGQGPLARFTLLSAAKLIKEAP